MASKPDLTAAEASMFTKHMKDPEFVKLFEDYAKAISEPEAMAEMNAYLTQLEAEGQAEAVYGKGVQLIVPEPWFVVKTKDESGANRVYINICTSPKVDEVKLAAADDGSGKPRQLLQLPMVLHGKDGKKGTAPDGGPLLVWDLAVNPNAVQHANTSRQGLDTLVNMAIERVEQVLGKKLLREYKLPRLKYKATPAASQPGVMAARTAEGGEVVDGRLRPQAEAKSAADSSPAANSNLDSSTANDQSACRSGFSFGKARPAATATTQRQESAAPSSPTAAGYKHACGAVTPSWTRTERHRTDVQQTWGDNGRALAAGSSAPHELVVRVQLPGVESAAAVQLDVVNQRLHVHVPGKHLLNLGPKQLRYSLLPDKVSAKFDKNKQMLSVTVAVAPPPPPQRQPQPQQQQQEALSVADEHGVEQPELQQQEQQEGSQQEHTQQQDAEHTVEQPADDVQHEESKLADATAVLTRQAGSTLAASKTSAQAQWHHLHQTLDKQQQQQDFASKTVVNHTQQQPQPLVVKPRLLSRRLSALADLD